MTPPTTLHRAWRAYADALAAFHTGPTAANAVRVAAAYRAWAALYIPDDPPRVAWLASRVRCDLALTLARAGNLQRAA